MLIAADYPFLDVFWTLLVFFAWVSWIMILFRVLGDIFRRQDASGWAKAGWIVFVIVLPFLGVLIYLIANGDEMGRRDVEQSRAVRAEFDDYVKSVAAPGGAAAEIEKAKQLLDSGAISQAEFDTIKARALAQPEGVR
jgi:Phospholipase_D-nuclease N-terminal/Short C-terminal domain